jgi:hypothetical protein
VVAMGAAFGGVAADDFREQALGIMQQGKVAA